MVKTEVRGLKVMSLPALRWTVIPPMVVRLLAEITCGLWLATSIKELPGPELEEGISWTWENGALVRRGVLVGAVAPTVSPLPSIGDVVEAAVLQGIWANIDPPM